MATKTAELREASTEELHEKVEELKSELFNLRFQKATGRLDNYKRLREVRKEIARALSVLRERELGIEPRPTAEEPERRRRRRLFRRRPVSDEEVAEEEEDSDIEEDETAGAEDEEEVEDEIEVEAEDVTDDDSADDDEDDEEGEEPPRDEKR
jgi:large subunit ribosomal protein L29